MKKILLSAVAMMAFGIASAQNDPKTPPTAPTPQATAPALQKDKSKTDAATQNPATTTSEQRKAMDGAQPRKDELKTQDHVKSTPDPEAVKDKNEQSGRAKKSKAKKTS